MTNINYEFEESIKDSEDHYADDGWEGTEDETVYHFDMVTGEWCNICHKEVMEREAVSEELAPFYRVAKFSLILSVSSCWLALVFIMVQH